METPPSTASKFALLLSANIKLVKDRRNRINMKDMNEIEGDLLLLDGAAKLSDARIARIAKFDEKLSQREKKKPLSPRERKEGQIEALPKETSTGTAKQRARSTLF